MAVLFIDERYEQLYHWLDGAKRQFEVYACLWEQKYQTLSVIWFILEYEEIKIFFFKFANMFVLVLCEISV